MKQENENNKRLHTSKFRKVSSEAISSVDYDELNKILEIEFKNGKIYQYKNILNKTWSRFLAIIKNEESLGTYVNTEFKKMIEAEGHYYHEII